MAAWVSTRSPVTRPSPSIASAARLTWSRPWASVRLASVRVAVHLTGRPVRMAQKAAIASSG